MREFRLDYLINLTNYSVRQMSVNRLCKIRPRVAMIAGASFALT